MPDPIVREDASTEDECEAVCHKDENCEAWTWVSRVASTVGQILPNEFPLTPLPAHIICYKGGRFGDMQDTKSLCQRV